MLATKTRRPVNRARKADVTRYAAPVGGWNARDSLATMDPLQAVRMDNFFPGFGSVSLRKGFTSYATGLGAQVKTLAQFVNGATVKFIAAANGRIWDISSAGAGVSLASGFAENAWQWAQFDDIGGGARIGLVNGTDAPQTYNGTVIAAMTVSGPASVNNLIGITAFKGRTFFVEKNSASFWYSALGALGGALTEFKLGRLSGVGGNLQEIATWSVDAGNGPADLCVFLMSSGDVIVYAGDNPGLSSSWQLVGIYKIGAPIGRRCSQKVGSELYVITKTGYVPMSTAAKLGLVKQSVAISDNIRGAVQQAVDSYGTLDGWQALLYPRGNYALFNVPVSASLFRQHIVNTETGAWCSFSNQNGYAWGLFNDRLYFGGSGVVYLADNGRNDAGMAIQGDCSTAWTDLGASASLKRIGLLRILGATTGGSIPFSIDVGTDFRQPNAAASGSVAAVNTSPWDTSPWDTTAWASENEIFDDWSGASGLGSVVNVRFRAASTNSGFEWYSTTYGFEIAGVL